MARSFLALMLCGGLVAGGAHAGTFDETAAQAAAVTGAERATLYSQLTGTALTDATPAEALRRLWMLYFLAETDAQRRAILELVPKVAEPDIRVLTNTLADYPGVEPQARKAQAESIKLLATLQGAKVTKDGKVSFPDSAYDARAKHEKFVAPPEWVGRWTGGGRVMDVSLFPSGVVAGKLGGPDQVVRPTVLGFREGEKFSVVGPGFRADWQGDHFALADGTAMKKTPVGVTGKAAPAGAQVLIGNDSAAWRDKKGQLTFKVLPGRVMEMQPGAQTHQSEAAFGDAHLYLEFRQAFNPDGMHALRGNSGVYLQSNYEIQMTDAFAVDPQPFLSGAIYRLATPTKVAAAPPMEWQSLEVEFHAPRFTDGKKTADARMTVWQNGLKIHDDVKIPEASGGGVGETDKPLPIWLQAHGGLLQFRNIWVEGLKDQDFLQGKRERRF